MRKITVVLIIMIAILLFLAYPPKRNKARPVIKQQKAQVDSSGKLLAIKYCGMCHLFPEPALLDKSTWLSSVLPLMGLRLGIRTNKDPYANLLPAERKIIRQLNTYPEKPLLTKQQWQEIVNYYTKKAPTTLFVPKERSFFMGTQFKEEEIFISDKKYPKTSLIKFDSLSKRLFIGDANNRLYILNTSLKLQSAWFTESAPVDINFSSNEAPLLLTIGTINPSDLKKGRLLSFDTTGINKAKPIINIDQLPRPVQFATGNLNRDGKKDVIVCGFGNHLGALCWYEGFDSNKKHLLTLQPGARKAAIRDMNNDNKPDIVVLMSQAWEEVLIFYNLGNGQFRKEKVLQFPPVYGVNYFELVDFNTDGFYDLLLTNGDNWDLSPIEKPYHGIRIFLNNGKNKFNKKFFFPLPGASKALARDFDMDGDLDIAAAAFYSNEQPPDHNFVYLENEGNLTYKPFIFPKVKGKWLTMEAADLDTDGDIDIVLGLFIHTASELTQLITSGVNSFPQVVVLHNKVNGQFAQN